MELFKNEICTISFIEAGKILIQSWKDFASFEKFKAAIDFTVNFSESAGKMTILSDTTKQKLVPKESSDYAMSVMPTLLKNGLQKMAFVLSESAFAEFAVRRFTAESRKELVNYFSCPKEAQKWLLE